MSNINLDFPGFYLDVSWTSVNLASAASKTGVTCVIMVVVAMVLEEQFVVAFVRAGS